MGQRESIEAIKERIEAEKAAERERIRTLAAESNKEWKAKQQAEAEAKEARLKANQDKLQAQRLAAFDAEHKTPRRMAYIAAGGSGADFDKLWESELREQVRLEVADVAAKRRVRAAAESIRSSF